MRGRRFALGKGRSTAVGSLGSLPEIVRSTVSASAAERVIGPNLSSVQQSAIAPCRLTRPKVGRNPVMPQLVDGKRIEPDVSEPIAKPTSPAATATPDPLEEPPLQKSRFHGVRPGPVNHASAPF